MYNNFSSKKTKKVISALLASALVVTSGPITADAATAKVVGIKKSITVSASATNKVTGLSKAEKNIVKVTKKGKKFTIKGLKAGKATFKIGKKSYTVKVGATTVKAAKTKLTLTKGKSATLKFTTKSGNGDTLTFKASNKNVTLAKKSAKIAKSAASVKATAKKAGKTTITATSKATGKKATVTVTVKNPAKPATTTPGASNTPVATATGSATNTPEATATATATASGSATNTPDVTATPVATATATPVATGSATNTPEATEVPTEAPTKAPEVVTGGTITVTVKAGDKVVTGASIKVLSGTSVVASTSESASTNFTTKKLENGTYTLVVERAGYETYTTTVVVNGDVAVDAELVAEATVTVKSIKAQNVNRYNDETYYDTMELSSKLPRNTTFSVEFSSTMDTDSVNINTVKLYKVDGNIPVGVTSAKITNKKKTVAEIKAASMEKNTEYKLILTSSISSEAGKQLDQTEYTFTTSNEGVLDEIHAVDNGTTSMKVSINSDLDTATTDYFNKDDVLYVTLDSAIDAGSITSDTVVLKNVTDGTNVNIKTELHTTNDATVAGVSLYKSKTIKITLLDDLKLKKAYKLELNGVRLANGGNLTSISQRFVVGSTAPHFTAKRTLGAASDNLSVSVDTVNRVNGKLTAINVPSKNIPEAGFGLVFNLSSVTNDDTVTEEAFALSDESTGKNIPFTFTYDAALKQVKITPTEDLPENTIVKITTSVNSSIKNTLGAALGEKDYYIQTYDLTAPSVTKITGETTNLKVNQQQTLKVDFSEKIGFTSIDSAGTVNVVPVVGGNDITGKCVTTAGEKLDSTKAIAIVKAGTDATSAIASGKFIKIDSAKVSADCKSLTIKYTPTTLGETYQLVIAGKNDDGRLFVSDVANGAGNEAANPLASNYTAAITTEAQDVTGPEVAAIGTGSTITDAEKAFDADKVKTFTSGATNIDVSKNVVIQFNELIASLTTANFNKAQGTNDANGNIVLERYDYAQGKWLKVGAGASSWDANALYSGTVGSESAAYNLYNNTLEKKTALVVNANVFLNHTKYRITINPTVNNISIKDVSANQNVMAKKYTVEFTTGDVTGLANPAADNSNIVTLTSNSEKGSSIVKATTGSIKNGNAVAVPMVDGSYMLTNVVAHDETTVASSSTGTTLNVTDGTKFAVGDVLRVVDRSNDEIVTVGSKTGNALTLVSAGLAQTYTSGNVYLIKKADGSIKLNDPLTSVVKSSSVVYDLGNGDDATGVKAQYATGIKKDAPILVAIQAGTDIDESTIVPSVKLFNAKDNTEVDATVTYKIANNKNSAWVSINPTEDLAADANYYVKVDGLKDRLGNTQTDITKKTVFSFKTATEYKKASVSDFNIYDGQMNVDVKTAITFKVTGADKTKSVIEAAFEENIQKNPGAATSVTAGRIQIVDMSADTGDKVDASVSYDEETGLVTITPTIPLKSTTEYQLRISESTFSNTAMDKDVTINFQTGAEKKPAIKSVKHIEAGASGLVGDRFIITLDSALKSSPAANGSNFGTFFTVANGSLSYNANLAGDGGIESVSISADKKVVTVVYGAKLASGDYVSDDYTTIAPKAALEAGDTDNTNVAFGTDAVKVTK